MTKTGWRRLGLAVAAAAALSGSARAQIKVPSSSGGEPGAPSPGLSSGGTRAPVFDDIPLNRALGLAREVGFQNARITKNTKKEDYVSGTVYGVPAAIYREKCQDGTCNVLSFYAYFGKRLRADFNAMNKFNQAYFVKLIQVGQGDWTLEMNVLLYSGVSEEHVRQLARIFVASVKLAQDFKPS